MQSLDGAGSEGVISVMMMPLLRCAFNLGRRGDAELQKQMEALVGPSMRTGGGLGLGLVVRLHRLSLAEFGRVMFVLLLLHVFVWPPNGSCQKILQLLTKDS